MPGCIKTLVVGGVLGLASPLAAQEVLEQFSYDSLGFSGLQADIGIMTSSQLESAPVGGVRLDFGFFAPRIRVMFGLSYTKSNFKPEEIAEFEARIPEFVTDPSGDDIIDAGEVSLSAFIADADLQYLFSPQSWPVLLYLGAGLTVQLQNGSGAAIDGTFVDDALDALVAGLNAMLVIEVPVSRALRITAEGRGTLLDGMRTASLRGGLQYRFGGR